MKYAPWQSSHFQARGWTEKTSSPFFPSRGRQRRNSFFFFKLLPQSGSNPAVGFYYKSEHGIVLIYCCGRSLLPAAEKLWHQVNCAETLHRMEKNRICQEEVTDSSSLGMRINQLYFCWVGFYSTGSWLRQHHQQLLDKNGFTCKGERWFKLWRPNATHFCHFSFPKSTGEEKAALYPRFIYLPCLARVTRTGTRLFWLGHFIPQINSSISPINSTHVVTQTGPSQRKGG